MLTKYKIGAVIATLAIIIGVSLLSLQNLNKNNASNVSHDSPLNPAMGDFFKNYDIYYTGWDNYMMNGEKLGITQTGTSSMQAFALGMSKNSTSTEIEAEIKRKMKDGETEGRALTIFPNSSYVIEDHSPAEANNSLSFAPTLLRFNGDTYIRDAINSDYFVDQNHIVYLGCLEQAFNEKTNGNLCVRFGLYVDHVLVDQTHRSTNISDLTISFVHNHTVYYSKTDSNINQGYFSYSLITKAKSSLNAENGFDCNLRGFINDKPVNLCYDFQSITNKSDISIGGIPTYHILNSNEFGVYDSSRVIVVNNHLYYTVVEKPSNDSLKPIKVSLIKDGLKVAQAEEDPSSYFNGAVYPSDGTQTGCQFSNDDPTPKFCIIGDDVISRSNFGFDKNEYYVNGQVADFTAFYNVILNFKDPKYDIQKPNIWQLTFLPSSSEKATKVIFLTLTPNNIYVSDLLPDAKISKPQLLISNVGAIVGASLK